MFRHVCCTFLLTVMFLAPGALAVTRQVPSQHATIQAAITASANGDVIIVAPGTYGKINFSGKGVTVRSSGGPAVTTIDAANNGSAVTCNTNETNQSVLEGFTIRGGAGTFNGISRFEGGGLFIIFADPVFKNCIIRNNTASEGGGVFAFFSDARFTNCVIHDNTATIAGAGLYIETNSAPILHNCTISRNTAPVGAGVNNHTSSPLLLNCIIWGNNDDSIRNEGSGGGAIVRYSAVQNGYAGMGNIATNPLFTNAAGGDFTLQAASPAIDSGDSGAISTTVFVDLTGAMRAVDDPNRPNTGVEVFGLNVDMGAYERQSGPVQSSCPGDLTSAGGGAPDGDVNVFDLLNLLGRWGACP